MKKRFYAKLLLVLFCLMSLNIFLPIPVNADTGPKPSVVINFNGLTDKICYGTLLSSTSSTGPSSAWNGEESSAIHNENESYEYVDYGYDIWKAFVDYKDEDGYYFLQEAWNVSETKSLSWTYYPPQKFKILLYFPETNTYAVSGICERYAFDTYYTVDVDEAAITATNYDQTNSTDARLDAFRSYNFRREAISLIIRVCITIVIEIVIALLFGINKFKQILTILCVNLITQILLNLSLNTLSYRTHYITYILLYIIIELLIIAIEAAVYCKVFKVIAESETPQLKLNIKTADEDLQINVGEQPFCKTENGQFCTVNLKGSDSEEKTEIKLSGALLSKIFDKRNSNLKYIIYAILANALSFVFGLGLYLYIPQLF